MKKVTIESVAKKAFAILKKHDIAIDRVSVSFRQIFRINEPMRQVCEIQAWNYAEEDKTNFIVEARTSSLVLASFEEAILRHLDKAIVLESVELSEPNDGDDDQLPY